MTNSYVISLSNVFVFQHLIYLWISDILTCLVLTALRLLRKLRLPSATTYSRVMIVGLG